MGAMQVIEGLHCDIAVLHKEVANRDDAIAEKEKRILDLKRKTQVEWRRR